jgi:hypothetical protein
VAIGSPNGGGNKGQVRIYNWNGSTWIQIDQGLYGDNNNDKFGNAVSISSDGNTVVVGAYAYNNYSGYVRIYNYNGSSWVQVGNDIYGEAAMDHSGHSVSISSYGNIVAIGSPYHDFGPNGNNAGHVRIYEWYGSSWNKIGDIDGETAGDQSGTPAVSPSISPILFQELPYHS